MLWLTLSCWTSVESSARTNSYVRTSLALFLLGASRAPLIGTRVMVAIMLEPVTEHESYLLDKTSLTFWERHWLRKDSSFSWSHDGDEDNDEDDGQSQVLQLRSSVYHHVSTA